VTTTYLGEEERMKTLGVRELKECISEILCWVEEEGETVEMTKRGEVIAHFVSVCKPQQSVVQPVDVVWTDLECLATEISGNWHSNVNAVNTVRDIRLEL